MHCVEKRDILSHQSFFRQINSLSTYLVNPLLSRNFCHKIFRQIKLMFNNHSVEKSSKTRSLILCKNEHFFRQINIFTKEVTKELISRKFLSVIAFYRTFPHCDNLFSNNVALTKFLSKSVRVNFLNFHSLHCLYTYEIESSCLWLHLKSNHLRLKQHQ